MVVVGEVERGGIVGCERGVRGEGRRGACASGCTCRIVGDRDYAVKAVTLAVV